MASPALPFSRSTQQQPRPIYTDPFAGARTPNPHALSSLAPSPAKRLLARLKRPSLPNLHLPRKMSASSTLSACSSASAKSHGSLSKRDISLPSLRRDDDAIFAFEAPRRAPFPPGGDGAESDDPCSSESPPSPPSAHELEDVSEDAPAPYRVDVRALCYFFSFLREGNGDTPPAPAPVEDPDSDGAEAVLGGDESASIDHPPRKPLTSATPDQTDFRPQTYPRGSQPASAHPHPQPGPSCTPRRTSPPPPARSGGRGAYVWIPAHPYACAAPLPGMYAPGLDVDTARPPAMDGHEVGERAAGAGEEWEKWRLNAGRLRAKEQGRLARMWARLRCSPAATPDDGASLPAPLPRHTKTKAKTPKFDVDDKLRRPSFMDLAPTRNSLAQTLALSFVHHKVHSSRVSRPPPPRSPTSPLSRTSCASTVFSDCGQEPGTPLTPASFATSVPPASSYPVLIARDYAFPSTPTSPTSSWSSADGATLVSAEEEEDWTLALDLALSTGMLIGAPRGVVPPALAHYTSSSSGLQHTTSRGQP
ncbi:hypothetical protein HWV62_28593 [Athelia sp. TMB]|nr:hypothetical protein HWV62_28593 [Athelia sp. TMB]